MQQYEIMLPSFPNKTLQTKFTEIYLDYSELLGDIEYKMLKKDKKFRSNLETICREKGLLRREIWSLESRIMEMGDMPDFDDLETLNLLLSQKTNEMLIMNEKLRKLWKDYESYINSF